MTEGRDASSTNLEHLSTQSRSSFAPRAYLKRPSAHLATVGPSSMADIVGVRSSRRPQRPAAAFFGPATIPSWPSRLKVKPHLPPLGHSLLVTVNPCQGVRVSCSPCGVSSRAVLCRSNFLLLPSTRSVMSYVRPIPHAHARRSERPERSSRASHYTPFLSRDLRLRRRNSSRSRKRHCPSAVCPKFGGSGCGGAAGF